MRACVHVGLGACVCVEERKFVWMRSGAIRVYICMSISWDISLPSNSVCTHAGISTCTYVRMLSLHFVLCTPFVCVCVHLNVCYVPLVCSRMCIMRVRVAQRRWRMRRPGTFDPLIADLFPAHQRSVGGGEVGWMPGIIMMS